ncbi:hypothetical protein ACH5RR_027923 [Cinchona calisaya]|uniref:Uncharacterized protein n=1 Tax=Cinchona calisaya TaxID=153742 RepID=A0ABD2YQJ1_9GENT
MENSVISMNKALSSTNNGKTTENPPEESSWTFYMQDFLYGHDHDNTTSNSFSSSYDQSSPSLISDAFSSAARKFAASDHKNEAIKFTSSTSNCKNMRRKAKGTAVNHHDDLEDTASSPVNSPKVSYIEQMNDNCQNEKDNVNVSQVNISRNISTGVIGNADQEENSNQSELKKRGLCLVPVSMLTNYIG